jgi:uncharacterized protein (DUF433 family)
MERRQSLLGVGIYIIPEASRMTGVSAGRIRRWLLGYSFPASDGTHESPPVWKPDLPEIEGALAVSFRDLMEVRFVDFFLEKGVSWKVLRLAASYAAQVVENAHPFSTFKFKTDGRRIFGDFWESRPKPLLDLVARQYTLPSFFDPYLYEGVEFHGNDPARWFPMRENRRVVIDPAIGFGQPTISPEGVPTAILARATKVERSAERVAKWYSVPVPAVQAAVEYENQLAA